MFRKLALIFIILSLQSCSNTEIGDRLENSFEVVNNQKNSGKTSQEKNKPNKIKEIRTSENPNEKVIMNEMKLAKDNSSASNKKVNQKSTKSIKNVIFNPQPYRIILKLSGANPSAPAETVTKALRKAGVQFEVEKIEMYDKKNFFENKSSQK